MIILKLLPTNDCPNFSGGPNIGLAKIFHPSNAVLTRGPSIFVRVHAHGKQSKQQKHNVPKCTRSNSIFSPPEPAQKTLLLFLHLVINAREFYCIVCHIQHDWIAWQCLEGWWELGDATWTFGVWLTDC